MDMHERIMKEIEEKNKSRKEEFLRFQDGYVREGTNLDKTILWISAGTLALSVNYVISQENSYLIYPYLLVVSWVLLLFCIISQVVGYKFSRDFHQIVMNELKKGEKDDRREKYLGLAKIFTDFSLYFFVIGTLFITIFAILNFLCKNA